MNNLAQILGVTIAFTVCLIACVIPVAVFAVVSEALEPELWGILVGLAAFGAVFPLTIYVAYSVLCAVGDWWDRRYD